MGDLGEKRRLDIEQKISHAMHDRLAAVELNRGNYMLMPAKHAVGAAIYRRMSDDLLKFVHTFGHR